MNCETIARSMINEVASSVNIHPMIDERLISEPQIFEGELVEPTCSFSVMI